MLAFSNFSAKWMQNLSIEIVIANREEVMEKSWKNVTKTSRLLLFAFTSGNRKSLYKSHFLMPKQTILAKCQHKVSFMNTQIKKKIISMADQLIFANLTLYSL